MIDMAQHEFELYTAFLLAVMARDVPWTPVPEEEFKTLPQADRRRLIHELKDIARTPLNR